MHTLPGVDYVRPLDECTCCFLLVAICSWLLRHYLLP